ncbi:ribonuclease H-like domain-containing protein [Yarrowia lipolytica]|jgi:ribonuclease HI|uniref:Ribonuclease H n=2 Tax=Yarrowia lipolytica TaxID=4952 RepID=Q6CHD9_YARLI|nr:YALI0A09878p [Yarrowia lipolytica CLIB122]AOW00463.1 hypothetical protein YALI1_A09741g [Yarrowia lipolytica]KAB8282935.1 ribonuclease H-like domain-containing protein [Yarrowia lipolytica]KAE8170952.1 ribonuclease H-like domain-containing protein [Yarrowia lipolytica]RDW23992.1 ribonuclease H-like domain-containing protein [Yarrowia lipolytica]RDW31661.1 ribonuclease H-like domain-containing protein [Yarrowia lipolytica]|eukprot:XP_499923.1 YALI0A09878p [Yarrowia lipolytica CLIB122]
MRQSPWILLQQYRLLTVLKMTKKNGPKQAFYAVQKGRKPGIYTSWSEVSPLVDGFSGSAYQKFTNRPAAEAFLRQNGYGIRSSTSSSKVTKPGTIAASAQRLSDTSVPVQTAYVGGITAIVLGGADHPIPVYTDGASRNNQSSNAKAGYGIFFGNGSEDNVSKPLAGMQQTNQRAELTAIYEACKIIKDRNDRRYYDIRTDSQYSISCLKEWGMNWERNGWKNSKGADVSNQDIIKPARNLLISLGDRVRLTKVKGHSSDPGNDAADALAVRGAEM